MKAQDMPESSPRTVIAILSTANFVTGIGAFVIVGLLNPLAADLGMSAAQAGWIMVVYALAYAVLSPLLVSATGRIGRRRVLAFAFGLFALSNLIAALATGPGLMFASRIIAAAGAGVVTPVAAAVAAGLSPPERRARALAAVFFGLTLAQVLGVPAGSYIAYTFGWRIAFGLVALLALPCLWLIWTRVPSGLSFAPVSLKDLGRTLGNLPQMIAVAFTAALMGSIYVIYTYISPLLAETMAFGRDGIALVLLIFGLGAVAGNLGGGAVTDRIGPVRTLSILAVAQMLIMPAFSLLPMPVPMLLILSFLWAIFGWSFMAAQQVRLISLDQEQASVLLALNAAAIYVGAALGSAIGSAVISNFGLAALGLTGGLCAIGALLTLFVGERMRMAQAS